MPSTQLQNSCVDENSDEMYKNKKKEHVQSVPSYCFSFLNMQICYLLVSRSSLPTLVSAKLLKFQNNPGLSRSFFELK